MNRNPRIEFSRSHRPRKKDELHSSDHHRKHDGGRVDYVQGLRGHLSMNYVHRVVII